MTTLPPPDLGPMLRRARRARGWSLRDVAAKTRTSKGYLSLLENGRRSPSTVFAELLADVLELDYGDAGALMAASVPGVGRARR